MRVQRGIEIIPLVNVCYLLFQLDSDDVIVHNDPDSISSDPRLTPDNNVTNDNQDIDNENYNPPFPMDNRLSDSDNRNSYVAMDTNGSSVATVNRASANLEKRKRGVGKESRYHNNREVTFEGREGGRTSKERVRVQGPLASSMKPKPVCINEIFSNVEGDK